MSLIAFAAALKSKLFSSGMPAKKFKISGSFLRSKVNDAPVNHTSLRGAVPRLPLIFPKPRGIEEVCYILPCGHQLRKSCDPLKSLITFMDIHAMKRRNASLNELNIYESLRVIILPIEHARQFVEQLLRVDEVFYIERKPQK